DQSGWRRQPQASHSYGGLTNNCAPDFGMMVSEIWQTPEQRRQSGVVVRGDKIDNITNVDIDTEFDATGLYHKSLAAHLKLGSGEELDVTGKVMGFIPLRNRREGQTTQ